MHKIETLKLVVGARPVEGASQDAGDGEESWLAQRNHGITATQIRDWGIASKRREVIDEKVNGTRKDLSGNRYVEHGRIREPEIARWVKRNYGIEPCASVYSHADVDRFLASPDGIMLHPFTGELYTGARDSAISEIKTTGKDLTPGEIDDNNVLVRIDEGSKFSRDGYYTQMQWQMYVMNVQWCLFVWEQHSGVWDESIDTFRVDDAPRAVWIERDDKMIEALVAKVAFPALEEIDAARKAVTVDDLPAASEVSSEHAMWVAELLKARDAEAVAKKAKEAAWAKLKEVYLAEGAPDLKIETDEFTISVGTSQKMKKVVDMERAKKRAPSLVERYQALIERYTYEEMQSSRGLTINSAKKKESK